MHPKDNLLRAYLDHELSQRQVIQLQEHLTRCPNCQTRLLVVEKRAQLVKTHFHALAPGSEEMHLPPQKAFQRFTLPRKELSTTMFKKRSVWVMLGITAVLVLSLSLTPVRAWASSFLSLFRVQQITVVSFDPTAVENAHDQLSSNRDAIQQIFKDDLQMNEHGKAQAVNSVDEAAAKAGFAPRLPGVEDQSPQLVVKPGMDATLTIDQPKLQALLDAAEVNVKLPESVDGKQVVVQVPDMIAAGYGNCSNLDSLDGPLNGCTMLAQLPSPTIDAPAGLDMQSMGAAMLEFLGMSKTDAADFSSKIDWTSTLILPIPQGEGFSYQDVNVDGVSGTFVQKTNEPDAMLLWVKDGRLYALRSDAGLEQALAIANSLP